MKDTQEVQSTIISHSHLSRSLDKLYDLRIQTVTQMDFRISPKMVPSYPRLSSSQEELSTNPPPEPQRNGECSSCCRRCSLNRAAFEGYPFVL